MANGEAYFGEPTISVPVRVSGPVSDPNKVLINNAVFTAQKVPTPIESGSTYDVTVTAKNTGNTIWTPGEYKLKIFTKGTDGNIDNWIVSDVDIPYDVVPGSEAVITFKLPAAVESGTYNFQTQLMKNGTLFGDQSSNIIITVN